MATPARKPVAWAAFRKYVDECGLDGPLEAVCMDLHVTLRDAFGPSLSPSFARARAACWDYLNVKGRSFAEIANMWGRNHTTVSHAVKLRRASRAGDPPG